MKWAVYALIFILLFMMVGCHADKGPLPSNAIAIIDGNPITIEFFRSEMDRRRGRFATLEQREAFLEELVRSELLYAAAQKAGYDKEPEILALQKRMIANKFRQDELESKLAKITITEEEIERYYREQLTHFTSPKMVRAAVIQITVPSGASEEKKAQLAQKAEQARIEALKLDPETRTFGSVAVKYSDDQSTRYRGGDSGWLKKGEKAYRWDKKVMDAIFSISNPGEVSPVIKTPSGFYIVKLMEIKESAPRPYQEVKEHIRYQVTAQKKAQAEAAFYEKLKRKIPVKINSDLLSMIELPDEGKKDKKISPPALPRG